MRVISAELEVGEIVLLEISLPLDLASKINLTKDKMITRMASLNFLRRVPVSPTPPRQQLFSLRSVHE